MEHVRPYCHEPEFADRFRQRPTCEHVMRHFFGFIAFAVLSLPVASNIFAATAKPARLIEIHIFAFNDFHGNIEPPKLLVVARDRKDAKVPVPAGGAAYLAGALESLRRDKRYSITVSSGDLIGASPIASTLFLDEPTILAMNALHLDIDAVGNHEFDLGVHELLRMKAGGCAQYTDRKPCALEHFPGAEFEFLAANAFKADGTTLFPATTVRRFGPIKIGFIGVTLKGTGPIMTRSGVTEINVGDEAETANALVPKLRAQGADAIVLLIHQGAFITGSYDDLSCPGLHGPLMPVLGRLDPSINIIVSGHTHQAYICEVPKKGGGGRLLTSAGKFGTLLTDIKLEFDAHTHSLVARRARFHIVHGQTYGAAASTMPNTAVVPADQPYGPVAEIVRRYSAAAHPPASEVVAHFSLPTNPGGDQQTEPCVAELTADAQLAWAAERGGADIAFVNSDRMRDLVPGPHGSITYGQLSALEPSPYDVVVKTFTGRQLKLLLEEQFESVGDARTRTRLLIPSANFAFSYDAARPPGERIVSATFDDNAIDVATSYRVATNSFLANGGEEFEGFTNGTQGLDVGPELDALEAYLTGSPKFHCGERVRDLH